MEIKQSIEWYRDQVVFLTGGTGTLGGCLLYKLALQLPTAKIFVLVRGSVGQAIEKWEKLMPEQVDDILDTGKIHFVVGDMTRPELGLKPTDLQRLRDAVTVVINAAADISLHKELSDTIQANCISHLTLSALLAGFVRLRIFLHVSTSYVNGFISEGIIEERIYMLGDDEQDPELELSSILSTGFSAHTHRFCAPYALAKYLAERLILSSERPFPVLIIRPSLIAPAIRDPYTGYGADDSIPIHTVIQNFVGSPDYGPTQLSQAFSHQQVVDEIPVDLVANTCLAHLALGTTGIVHAAAQLYVARTFKESIDLYQKYTPEDVAEKIRNGNFRSDQVMAPSFFKIAQQSLGDSTNDCRRSCNLKDLAGPVGLSLEGHDPEAFMKFRIKQLSRVLGERLRVGS